MTGPEHYREAERLIAERTIPALTAGSFPLAFEDAVALAQVHAVLALAAVAALGTAGAESRAWADVAGTRLSGG
jgi:hypothetical protein